MMNATVQSNFPLPLVEAVADKVAGRRSRAHTSPVGRRSSEGRQTAQCGEAVEVVEAVEGEKGNSRIEQVRRLPADEVPARYSGQCIPEAAHNQ